ncbi:hypothetical protein MVEG_04750 [Podila verticillata NRRL 6337]|nr:hypothetical protein MVEG_04750 [Podila verticillata NRRL 6337]
MSSLRTVSNALPRISMARIPLVAFTNNPATLTSPSNNAHPSSFSSMAANQKDSSSWSKSAKNVAGKLEHSAKKMAKEDKDYLREAGPSSSSSASSTSSKLSSYASDAIRMVESHNILKHDRAPIHDMRDEDPSQHRTNIKIK